jgi:hypothetical protein
VKKFKSEKGFGVCFLRRVLVKNQKALFEGFD